MGSARTSRLALVALPVVLAAGCRAAPAEAPSPPALLFSALHTVPELEELRDRMPPHGSLATSSAAVEPATPWIVGLYGPVGSGAVAPRRSAAPWSEDPLMTIEPPVYTRYLTLAYGEQTVTDDDAQRLDIDEERVYGLDFDSFDVPSGHGWECGVNFAGADGSFMGIDGEYRSRELYLGYRRTFFTQVPELQPYVSVGVMHMRVEVELGPMDADDTAYGAYGRLGLNWLVSDRVRVGVDYRHVYGTEIDAMGLGIDSDHDQLAFTVGYGF